MRVFLSLALAFVLSLLSLVKAHNIRLEPRKRGILPFHDLRIVY
jgi:hypothetical protein